MTPQNVKLTVAYDGSAYLGWQKTPMGLSIESALQSVLEQILQEKVFLQAASRTDAGVHALGQVVNFFSSKPHLNLNRLKHSANGLLPNDIMVLDALQADAAFHPTLDSAGKEYHYYICAGSTQLPQHRLYSWHYPYTLNYDAMFQAAKIMVGKHDFSTLCNTKKTTSYHNFEREVTDITIEVCPNNRVHIKVSGINFLYKMVRNIVGTLIYIGKGKIPLEALPHILQSRDRTQAGITAPAHGLFLAKVFY